ncbi:HAD-IA family hydrolase [Paenibacillus spongiae]|uniref:HAD-IA family hydrolase n=1 Tax=Paenibacillus spongiae TaxID=2909671 RepID=A0ABY5S2D7_9BACL|nr:HAD-IA family hydrolase [Paenibacillus spongiae]UVI28044.1 HAD-IA family hydrolase [Paenibacillus spongiae]
MHILWDFDGTLFDTYPAYTKILKDVLEVEIEDNDIFSNLKISFTHAVRHFKLSERQIQEIFRRESELVPEQTPPFPDVELILQTAGKNVIMTHKARSEVVEILNYYGWGNYFADIVAGDDGFPKKPDPASYIHLHNRHRVDLIIGDREIDILPGKALGIQTCLFQNDAPGADYYLWAYKEFDQHIRLK